MNIKAKMMTWSLLGFTSLGIAENNNQDIHNTKFFNHVAVSVSDTKIYPLDKRYKIIISKAVTKPNPENDIVAQHFQPMIQAVGEPIWAITSDQLPLTENDCYKADIDTCSEEDPNCYKFCLANLDPEVVSFDEKANKLYFIMGTNAIGSGGGPALLFVGNVSTKEIKFIAVESYGEKGSLSPSGKYLALYSSLYGSSIISVYDTINNTMFDINKSENIYTKSKEIRHFLNIKKWLNDTQFTYTDVTRSFTHKTEPMPFISAKEVIYDIEKRQVVHARSITEDEANAS